MTGGVIEKTDYVTVDGTETPTEVIKITIKKENADDGELITEAEAKFKITYRGKDDATTASSLSNVTDIKFSVTKGTRSGSTFTTTEGEIEVTITVYFEKLKASSDTIYYVKNWSQLFLTQQTYYSTVLLSGNTGSETSTTSPTPEAGAVFMVVTATYDEVTDSYTVPNPKKYYKRQEAHTLVLPNAGHALYS